MTREELEKRVRERLEMIRATKDAGVYARFYTEDCTALLELLAAPVAPETPSE